MVKKDIPEDMKVQLQSMTGRWIQDATDNVLEIASEMYGSGLTEEEITDWLHRMIVTATGALTIMYAQGEDVKAAAQRLFFPKDEDDEDDTL